MLVSLANVEFTQNNIVRINRAEIINDAIFFIFFYYILSPEINFTAAHAKLIANIQITAYMNCIHAFLNSSGFHLANAKRIPTNKNTPTAVIGNRKSIESTTHAVILSTHFSPSLATFN